MNFKTLIISINNIKKDIMKQLYKVVPIMAMTILLMAGTFLITTCEENDVNPKDTTNVGTMNISNIQYTDCLSYLPSNDSIIVRKEGESLKIEHHNFAIPCKFDSIVVSYAFYGDTLAVTEMPDPYYNVNCVCVISNSFQINNIPHGQYVLVIGNYPYVIKHISSVNF